MAIYCSHNIQPLEMLIQTATFSGKYTRNPLLNQFSISIPIPIMRHSNSHDCTISRFSLLQRMQGGFNTFEIFHYRLFSLERPIFTAGGMRESHSTSNFHFLLQLHGTPDRHVQEKRDQKSHSLSAMAQPDLQINNNANGQFLISFSTASVLETSWFIAVVLWRAMSQQSTSVLKTLQLCILVFGNLLSLRWTSFGIFKGGILMTMDLSYEIYFPPQIFFHYKIRCACLTEFLIIAF